MKRILTTKEKVDGFYVYALLDPSTSQFIIDNAVLPHHPFYVGKGKGYRAWDHEKEKLSESCNKHKIYKIKEIKEKFSIIPIAILKDGLTDDQSLILEGQYAEEIGYDKLTNINPCGVRNPVLHGEKNGFYKKKHTNESISKMVKGFKTWHNNLTNEEKTAWRNTRKASSRLLHNGGYTRSKESIEQGLKTRFGNDYREKLNQREADKQKEKLKRKERTEAREQDKLARGWAHLEGEELSQYWKNHRAGNNNGMFGKGHLLANENNGRAKKYIVTIGDDVFLIHGKLKYFQQSFKKFYKCSNPLRSQGFIEKYNVTVMEVTEFNVDGILFVDEHTFSSMEEKKYTKCKKSNSNKT
jgi:hypothetical protein